ncbi:hypothetical protein MN608_05673 [Microdochium nivale]|nr:hypothetical protein MN608_05673 [Microdochium nivale]
MFTLALKSRCLSALDHHRCPLRRRIRRLDLTVNRDSGLRVWLGYGLHLSSCYRSPPALVLAQPHLGAGFATPKARLEGSPYGLLAGYQIQTLARSGRTISSFSALGISLISVALFKQRPVSVLDRRAKYNASNPRHFGCAKMLLVVLRASSPSCIMGSMGLALLLPTTFAEVITNATQIVNSEGRQGSAYL